MAMSQKLGSLESTRFFGCLFHIHSESCINVLQCIVYIMLSSMWPNCSQSLPSPSWNQVKQGQGHLEYVHVVLLLALQATANPPQTKHRTTPSLVAKCHATRHKNQLTEILVKKNLILCTNEYAELHYICWNFGLHCPPSVRVRVCDTMLSSPATWIPCETDCLSSHASHKSQRAPNLHSKGAQAAWQSKLN